MKNSQKKNRQTKKLNSLNLGLSGGIIWGGSLFLLTLISLPTGFAEKFLNLFQNVYPGYGIGLPGALAGLFLGFLDGFIALYLFGLIYNWLNDKKTK